MSDKIIGILEGDICNRNGCIGEIGTHPSENCSCHINPPCGSCTSPRNFCFRCGWEEKDDKIINGFVVNIDKETGNYRCWTPRELDTTKIDWRSREDTHFSMIKEGCYPPGTSSEEVRKLVNGTFGGRFIYFNNGRFEFVAYTD